MCYEVTVLKNMAEKQLILLAFLVETNIFEASHVTFFTMN
jgi:hypothetical protein